MRFEIYPVTIIKDRYGGTYSGALWTAWNEYCDDVPMEADSSDVVCMKYWNGRGCAALVGKGNTPEAAYQDLERRYVERNG